VGRFNRGGDRIAAPGRIRVAMICFHRRAFRVVIRFREAEDTNLPGAAFLISTDSVPLPGEGIAVLATHGPDPHELPSEWPPTAECSSCSNESSPNGTDGSLNSSLSLRPQTGASGTRPAGMVLDGYEGAGHGSKTRVRPTVGGNCLTVANRSGAGPLCGLRWQGEPDLAILISRCKRYVTPPPAIDRIGDIVVRSATPDQFRIPISVRIMLRSRLWNGM
jgi:hypothetical protein